MTTHKPVTEADIAAALDAVESAIDGSQWVTAGNRLRSFRALLAALPEPEPTAREDGPLSEPCPYCSGAGCLPCRGRGTVGPAFRANRGVPPFAATSSRPAAPELRAALERLVAVVDAASIVWRDPVPADAMAAIHNAKVTLADRLPPSRSRETPQ